MLADLLLLLAALVLVFVAAEAFTNAVEHLGERIGVSEGVAGSIFAAVGTAMPETIVPIVAILFGGADPHLNAEIGVGAILGAPFMLGTIAFGVLAIAAGTARGWRAPLRPEASGLRRDLGFFLALFTLSVITGLIEAAHAWKAVVAIALIFGYFFYLLLTVRASKALVEEGHGVEAENPLYFGRVLGERGWVIGLQLVAALAVLILGARLFVRGVEGLSAWLGISALVVSLLIVPIATELPEKVNSVLWIRRGKDTLAFGNITGAMVFQGTLIPAIGMLLTPWRLARADALVPACLALAGAGLIAWWAAQKALTPRALLVHFGLYLVYAGFVAFAMA